MNAQLRDLAEAMNGTWRISQQNIFKQRHIRRSSGDSATTIKSDVQSLIESHTEDEQVFYEEEELDFKPPIPHLPVVMESSEPSQHSLILSSPPITAMTLPLVRSPTIQNATYITPRSVTPPRSDDQAMAKVHRDLDILQARGTGNHRCPFGTRCTKGGFRDGQVVVMKRNSAYRSVGSHAHGGID